MTHDKSQNISDKIKPQNPWTNISTIIVIIILIISGVVVYLRYFVKDSFVNNIISNNNSKKETPKAVSKLDGTLVEKDLASRYPLAVIVENHPEARPQSGLDKASIVYEAISEGGITRFLAVYSGRNADLVGPIRSARTYFVDWLSEYNAYFAHVGGNLDALDMIKADAILDLDQFGLGIPTYWRKPDPTKAIEHTMYSSTELLYKAATNKKYQSISQFQALNFRKAKPSPDSAITQAVTIDFSTPQYKVIWEFNPQTNTYLRSLGGTPHRDSITGDRLAASNLIIQEVDRWEAPTTINEQGWAMKTIGSGRAKIFIEGKETDCTWKKTGRTNRTIFYDTSGTEIDFIPGQFWYEITPPEVFKMVKIS